MWKIWSHIYQWMRRPWPLSLILERERDNLFTLCKSIALTNDAMVVDLGCGKGEALRYSGGINTLGVDFIYRMVKESATKYDQCIVADVLSLPFYRNFEMAMAIGLSEYVPIEKLIFECENILKPGGYLLITSSPPGFFTFLRKFIGVKIYPRSSQNVIIAADDSGFVLLEHIHFLSQDSFLFQRRF